MKRKKMKSEKIEKNSKTLRNQNQSQTQILIRLPALESSDQIQRMRGKEREQVQP
jgi:hypothetical protein